MIITIPQEAFLPNFVQHLYNKDRYLLLYGGRGGGKTDFAVQKLVVRCLEEKNFRCIGIRKTYASIKDSQFQTLKDIITQWGLADLFVFKLSPLEIMCRPNGNKFIFRGLDDSAKTKSIKDPSAIWYEEANELTEEDFVSTTTSIRTTKAKYLQEILTFNPECSGDYKDFWIYKRFFSSHTELSFSDITTVELAGGQKIELKYTVVHSNHETNPHLTPEYRAQLELLKASNPYYYNVYVLGLWGKKEVKSPWAFNFNREKHVKECSQITGQRVRFSLDFNVNPFVCIVGSLWKDNHGYHVRIFDEYVINDGDIYKMSERIRASHDPIILANALYTGDATQRKKVIESRGNKNAWQIMDALLSIGSNRLQVPKSNPPVSDNRHVINAVLALADVQISPRCVTLINDLEGVESDPEGGIVKKSRANEAQRSDALDVFRYFCNTWMQDFVLMMKKQIKR